MEPNLREVARDSTVKRLRPLKRRDARPEYAIFTAIEGTLLDFDSFDGTAARSLVRELQAAGIPLVPVTSMTLGEMEIIAERLGLRGPMIVETGGAIARWEDGRWTLEAVGPAADTLLEAICDIETLSGADLAVASALSEFEYARLSGRSGAMLRASMQRRFSEPFLIERGDIRHVVVAADSLGFVVHRGKRFYYLVRKSNDGEAFARVRAQVRAETTIALGGSPIDAGFLSRADIPIIVPRPDGHPDAELLARIPNVVIASAPGAAGWAGAVRHAWTALRTAETCVEIA